MIRIRWMVAAACVVTTATACDDDDLLLQAALNDGLPLVEAFQVPFHHADERSEELIQIFYRFTNQTDGTLFFVMQGHEREHSSHHSFHENLQ